MSVTPSLVDIWTAENNSIIRKWKEYENGQQSLQDMRKHCYEEFLGLHQKIQGVPANFGQLKLEITVLYNTLVFSLGYCTLNETKDHIINALVRALEAVQKQVSTADLVTLWQVVLRTFGGTADEPWIHKLLLIQWLIWLSECQFEKIVHLFLQTNQTLSAPSEDLLAETRNLGVSIQEDASLLVVLAAKDLKELLHISTFISNGVEQMKKENYTEAFLALQEAMTLPSPRTLLAHVHILTGLSYAKLQQPQSALQCYRKALEMDFGCQRALYQSSLVYRQLGNCHAEIEALRLLHSAALLHAERGSSSTPNPLLSPDMLLGGEQMAFICQTPSPLQVLYTLGNRCVLSGRNSEGAECYLDLLASLQSDPTRHAPMKDILPLPRIPMIYLEAAFALLKSRRFWDALAICDEVIATTVDLVPERLLIKLPITTELETLHPEPDAPERLECVLWSGAAYFLQGQAHFQLKDTKEALTSFTRAINQLVKVRIKQKLEDSVEAGAVDHSVVVLEALKAKVLAIRGLCFVERGRLNEALRDFQLSLQASKGCRNTEMWLVEVMWRLDRKEEAAAMWKQIQNSTESSTLVELPLYLQTWQEDGTRFDQNDLNKKMEEFIAGRVV